MDKRPVVAVGSLSSPVKGGWINVGKVVFKRPTHISVNSPELVGEVVLFPSFFGLLKRYSHPKIYLSVFDKSLDVVDDVDFSESVRVALGSSS